MKKRTLRSICGIAGVLFLALLIVPYFVGATAVEDVQALQKQLEDVRQKGKDLEQKEEDQKAYKSNLENQVSIIQQQIAVLAQSIEDTKVELAQKQAELDQKRRDIADTEDLFEQRLRAMQVNHTSGALSTILAVNTFDELLTASTTLSRISIADTDLLKKLAQERQEMEMQEAAINAELEQLQADNDAQNAKKTELAGSLQQVDASLTDLEAQQKANEQDEARLLEEYTAARAAAEAELNRPSDNTEFVGGSYGWPVPGYSNISSGYGWRTLYGKADFHTGIDISGGGRVIYGAGVAASLSGTVQTTVYGSRGYGYYIIVDHGGNNKTLYGHLSAIYVTPGQTVIQGDTIGAVGSTGNSTGPHLHFEIRQNGQKVDPAPLLGR